MRTRCLLTLLVLWPCIVWGQEAKSECAGRPTVTFDHTAKPDILSASLRLSDKDKFLIQVINTAPKAFTYTVAGAVAVPQQTARLKAEEAETIYEQCVTHSKQFGGYLMRVERNGKETTELPNKLFIVSVETMIGTTKCLEAFR